jgi:uncharacterized membrane protein/plastocyanin
MAISLLKWFNQGLFVFALLWGGPVNQDIFDWILLLVRWLHITVAVTWIGTSIFFMWLDRSFERNESSKNAGHVGEVWMVHGGGFYHVEKLLMGPTKVPEKLHWFKWESYWTWLSGMMLMTLIFYWGDGTFLLDDMVSDITHAQGIALGLFSLIGSWFFYDFLWERELTKHKPAVGHILTLLWLGGMSYFLCKTLSGRAAYMHIGGMMGTWMTANVFMRIIPRQIKMVEASRKGEPVNQDWGKNAKNRSTHNTYLTLPVIFVMLSNHFPNTYGHDLNWLILLIITAGGACIREYFVVRLSNPKRSVISAIAGIALISGVVVWTSLPQEAPVAEAATETEAAAPVEASKIEARPVTSVTEGKTFPVKGMVTFEGTPPKGKKLTLPAGCGPKSGGDHYSNEVIVNNGKLENVLITIKNPPAVNSPVPSEEVVLDQRGCMYHPRIAAARVGQKVTFVNSDAVFHNVRSVTTQNQRFNMAMPKKDQRITKIFTRPELFLQAKCSVHPWMGAYVAVMEHPFYAVTNARGEFQLPSLPAGTYIIEAWHEVFGTQTQEITVTESGAPDVQFSFKGKP